MMNGTILYFRHSLNMINLPTRPFPSWNGWIRSNFTWKSRISSKAVSYTHLCMIRCIYMNMLTTGLIYKTAMLSQTAYYFLSVSYTHLDVYKRQLLNKDFRSVPSTDVRVSFLFLPFSITFFPMVCPYIYLPVFFLSQDVYKRQAGYCSLSLATFSLE